VCISFFFGWATSIVVVPAYENGNRPYGDASSVLTHSWDGWIINQNSDWDIGIIDLDRPVGALTGWHSYGYSDNPSFFTGNTFYNANYPTNSPYDGQYMYEWHGNFDYAEYFPFPGIEWYGNEVGINKRYYEGSGSGAYWMTIVYAVLSNGDSSHTNFTRITSDEVGDIDGWIADDTPVSPDLIPLDVKVSPENIVAGTRLSTMSFVVHNYSKSLVPWVGTLRAYPNNP
jgi:hypothetical protein